VELLWPHNPDAGVRVTKIGLTSGATSSRTAGWKWPNDPSDDRGGADLSHPLIS
jgi:hypothetical protein